MCLQPPQVRQASLTVWLYQIPLSPGPLWAGRVGGKRETLCCLDAPHRNSLTPTLCWVPSNSEPEPALGTLARVRAQILSAFKSLSLSRASIFPQVGLRIAPPSNSPSLPSFALLCPPLLVLESCYVCWGEKQALTNLVVFQILILMPRFLCCISSPESSLPWSMNECY